MKRLLLFILISILFLTTALAEDNVPVVWLPIMPATGTQSPNYDDDRTYSNFVGRLYIDDQDVDVALYLSNDQEVVDREDAAAYFDLSYARGHMIIADHNNHAFGSLDVTKIGTYARIVKEDGEIEFYVCTAIFKGRNTGKGITDIHGNNVADKADLMMYTCYNGWQNVWVVLWEKTLSPEEQQTKDILTNFITNSQALIDEMLQRLNNPSIDTGEDIELQLVFQPN